MVGLGWDTECDIDASVLMYDKDGEMKDDVYFN